MIRSFAVAVLAAALVSYLPVPAAAQQAQDYFIPGQAKPGAAGAPSAKSAQKPAQRPAPVQVAPPQLGTGAGAAVPGAGGPDTQEAPPQLNVQLPPPPDLPALPKGDAPPAAVIGVMGVPEVMRASAAAQQVERVIGERRAKLNEDAQKEQAVWREMQQSLANDRPKLSADQVRTRERQLQERITEAQRQFRDRNRIIQEAAQYALAQIERTLISVIRQVAEARGMNLVLHRAQVALNVNQFDITDQVAEQLNKILPSVVIPPDGVSPSALAKDSKAPAAGTAAATPAAATTPAPAAPPAPAATPAPAQ
jgi:Skp family chaperone for outer membrane proteins